MRIEVKLTFKDYLRLMFALTYKKVLIWALTMVGIVLLIVGMLAFISAIFGAEQSSVVDSLITVFMGLIFTLLAPWSTYRNAKRIYGSSTMIKEKVSYEIDNENIRINGESFSSKLSWSSIFKVEEIEEWILIYQNKVIANILPKKNFGDEQLVELNRIVSNHLHIKNKLK